MTRRSLRNLTGVAAVVCALTASTVSGVAPVEESRALGALAKQTTNVTVLSGAVEASADGITFRELVDGQSVGGGELLRATSRSSALLTFYDGTEILLPANASLDLRAASVTSHLPTPSPADIPRRIVARVLEERRIVSRDLRPVPPSVGLIRG